MGSKKVYLYLYLYLKTDMFLVRYTIHLEESLLNFRHAFSEKIKEEKKKHK